ncbi:MAG: 5-(carboxyamino)imidazole ribonucleotide mutase [Desulfovibrionaceae bacterium]|nr:5-(carboxyamino)imidazole ribonucleotide mutase [Desulfovibrionaceae bacterium]
MQAAKVAVFMGSKSDEAMIAPCAEILKQLEIPFVFTVASAHRTPERTAQLTERLEAEGCEVFICAAGMAAHLAGAVAARTIKPVIGIPVAGSPLCGMDALFATVQMPPGFPVATVALDKAGARNAAWLAAQILALKDPNLAEKLQTARKKFRDGVESAAQEMEAKYMI